MAAHTRHTNLTTTLDLSLPTSETGCSVGPWWSDATARAGYTMMTTTYRLGQIKRGHFTFLLLTNECIY